MEKDLIISVIVPIYNAEKFIHRAVDSILCQMDGRIELILEEGFYQTVWKPASAGWNIYASMSS